MRQMGYLERRRACFTDVLEDDNRAHDLSIALVNRGDGIGDRHLASIPTDQDGVALQHHLLVLDDAELQQIADWLARDAIDDAENIVRQAADGLFASPTRGLLGGAVKIGHVANGVGTQDRITDELQGDCGLRAFG